MFCSNCGKQIAENDKFCCGCGNPVESFVPAEPAPVSEPEICAPKAPVAEPCCECVPEAPAAEPCCECVPEAPAAEPCCECAPEAPVAEPCCECVPEAPVAEPCCECVPEGPVAEPCCECAPEVPAAEPCCECAPEVPSAEPRCECAPEAPAAEPCCECAPEVPADEPHNTSAYPAYNFGAPQTAPAEHAQSESFVNAPEPVFAPEVPAEPVFEQPVYQQPVYESAPAEFAPPVFKQKNGLRITLGVLLILFAVAPYVLPYYVQINTNTTALMSALMYSQDHYSIVTAFQSLLGMAEPMFYFTASMAALIAGCALVMKHRGSGKLLKASIVINIIAIAFAVVSAAVLYFLPDVLVRILGGGNSYAELARLIMEEIPEVLLYLMKGAMYHVAVCIVALVVSLLIKKGTDTAWRHAGLYDGSKECAIMVIPYVMAVAKLAVMLVERYVLVGEDSLNLSISSLAQSLISSNFSIYILAFAMLAVLIAVLGKSVGALPLSILWTVLAAAGAAVVITGAGDIVTSYMRIYGIGMEYYSLIANAFMAYAGITAIWLIGLGIWMIASARGAFPVWLQILLGVVVLAVYAALEIVRPLTGLAFYIQIGSLGVLVVTIVASIVGMGAAKRAQAKSYTAPAYEGAVIEEAPAGEESPF